MSIQKRFIVVQTELTTDKICWTDEDWEKADKYYKDYVLGTFNTYEQAKECLELEIKKWNNCHSITVNDTLDVSHSIYEKCKGDRK